MNHHNIPEGIGFVSDKYNASAKSRLSTLLPPAPSPPETDAMGRHLPRVEGRDVRRAPVEGMAASLGRCGVLEIEG